MFIVPLSSYSLFRVYESSLIEVYITCQMQTISESARTHGFYSKNCFVKCGINDQCHYPVQFVYFTSKKSESQKAYYCIIRFWVGWKLWWYLLLYFEMYWYFKYKNDDLITAQSVVIQQNTLYFEVVKNIIGLDFCFKRNIISHICHI